MKASTGALVKVAMMRWMEVQWYEFIKQTEHTKQPRKLRNKLEKIERLLRNGRFNNAEDVVAFMVKQASSLFDSKEACEAFVRAEAERAINANKTNGATH